MYLLSLKVRKRLYANVVTIWNEAFLNLKPHQIYPYAIRKSIPLMVLSFLLAKIVISISKWVYQFSPSICVIVFLYLPLYFYRSQEINSTTFAKGFLISHKILIFPKQVFIIMCCYSCVFVLCDIYNSFHISAGRIKCVKPLSSLTHTFNLCPVCSSETWDSVPVYALFTLSLCMLSLFSKWD